MGTRDDELLRVRRTSEAIQHVILADFDIHYDALNAL